MSAIEKIALAGMLACVVVTSTQAAQRGQIMLERSFPVGAGGALEIDVDDGDIEVRTHRGSGVEVEVWAYSPDMDWARELFERMDFEVSERSNVVSIVARSPRITRAQWRTHRRGVSVDVRISIPERFNVNIKTSDGDIAIGNVSGSVVLNTNDGDVTLQDVSGPELLVRSSDGDIIVGATRTERLDIQSSDGDITLGAAVGSIRLETSDGNIQADQLSGSIRLETSDGDISVAFADVTHATLRTGDGDIVMFAPLRFAADVDFAGEDLTLDRDVVIRGSVSRRRLRGQINGGGASINARSGDGSITLRSARVRP